MSIGNKDDLTDDKVVDAEDSTDDVDDDINGDEGDDDINGGDGNDDLDGAEGDDNLIGGLGNDILRAGFGQDHLTGGEGNNIFGFYAAGDFIVEDFDVLSDMLFFDSETTGLNNVEDLLNAISNIEDNKDGVVFEFEFGNGIASITLVGVNLEDLGVGMLGFS